MSVEYNTTNPNLKSAQTAHLGGLGQPAPKLELDFYIRIRMTKGINAMVNSKKKRLVACMSSNRYTKISLF